MKKIILASSFVFTTLFLIQSSAIAYQGFYKQFRKTHYKQMYHIQQGYRQDHFTFQELQNLIITQHKIKKLANRYAKDGHYDHKEKKILKKKSHELDKMIKRIRNNNKKRYHRYGKHFKSLNRYSS